MLHCCDAKTCYWSKLLVPPEEVAEAHWDQEAWRLRTSIKPTTDKGCSKGRLPHWRNTTVSLPSGLQKPTPLHSMPCYVGEASHVCGCTYRPASVDEDYGGVMGEGAFTTSLQGQLMVHIQHSYCGTLCLAHLWGALRPSRGGGGSAPPSRRLFTELPQDFGSEANSLVALLALKVHCSNKEPVPTNTFCIVMKVDVGVAHNSTAVGNLRYHWGESDLQCRLRKGGSIQWKQCQWAPVILICSTLQPIVLSCSPTPNHLWASYTGLNRNSE